MVLKNPGGLVTLTDIACGFLGSKLGQSTQTPAVAKNTVNQLETINQIVIDQ